MMDRLRALAMAIAIFSVSPVRAEIININFSGNLSGFNQGGFQASGTYPDGYTTAQIDYFNSFELNASSPGSAYQFSFNFDTTSAASDAGAGIVFPLEFLSGQIGSFSDFSAFSPFISFVQGGTYSFVNFNLVRTETLGPNLFFSYAIFTLRARNSDNLLVVNELPDGPFQFSNAYADFRVQAPNNKYRTAADVSGAGIVSQQTMVPPSLAVPEPESWAMLIAGFGLVGASLRWRRAALPNILN